MSRTAGMADAAGKSGSAVTAAGRVVIIVIPRNLPPLLRGITVNIAAERQIETAVSHILVCGCLCTHGFHLRTEHHAHDELVAVRSRKAGDIGQMKMSEFVEKIQEEIEKKVID